jgi:hypothetical protein
MRGPELLWRTRRVSWDGVRKVALKDFSLFGEAYNPMDDSWHSFSVNLRDGKSVGGSYNGPDE